MAPRKWTTDEESTLINHTKSFISEGKIDYIQVGKQIDRTERAVKFRLKKIINEDEIVKKELEELGFVGDEIQISVGWNDETLLKLISLMKEQKSIKEIADEIGKTERMVRGKMKKIIETDQEMKDIYGDLESPTLSSIDEKLNMILELLKK